MNKGLIRLAIVATGSFVASFAILDTVAVAGLVSAPRRKLFDKSVESESNTIRPRIIRNSAFMAVAITGITATVLSIAK